MRMHVHGGERKKSKHQTEKGRTSSVSAPHMLPHLPLPTALAPQRMISTQGTSPRLYDQQPKAL